MSGRRPRARPLDIEVLYHTHIIAGCYWSHDGRHIYLETNLTGRFNIWRMPAEGGWPVQVTVSDERTVLQEPSPDGRWLVYTEDIGGNEKPNIFALPVEGGEAVNLTRTEGVGYSSIRWSPDGRWLAFASERERPGSYAVYIMDPLTRDVEKVAGVGLGRCVSLRWSPDGRRLALTRTHDFLHTGVSILDLATREERVLVPIDGSTASSAEGWTPDGQAVVIESDANERGVPGIAVFRLEGQGLEWVVLDDWESSVADISPRAPWLVYVRNEGGSHRVYLRHMNGAEREVPLPAGVLSAARFSPDGRRLLLLHSSPSSPNEVWVYDVSTGELEQRTSCLVAGLTEDDFVRPQLVVYPSFDGTPITAFVYVPPNIEPDGSHPAIVYPHGGPTWQHMNGWFPNLQYLVSHGFVVIAPNFRGSTGFGQAFREANRRDLGGGDLRDVVAAAEFLKRSGYADPRRIAIMGASYGGYLALMALTKYPDIWAAGVAVVPFANWFTEYENEDPVLQAFDRWMMGDPVADAELWRDRSPIFFADRIRAPLLLLAGANDIRCPAEETRQIVEAVRRSGGVAEAVVYNNEGHSFARRENRIDSLRRTAEFLRRHLLHGVANSRQFY